MSKGWEEVRQKFDEDLVDLEQSEQSKGNNLNELTELMPLRGPQKLNRQEIRGRECEMEENKGPEV